MRIKNIRKLKIPDSCEIVNGSKHFKLMRFGRLIRIVSKGTKRRERAWLRYAIRKINL